MDMEEDRDTYNRILANLSRTNQKKAQEHNQNNKIKFGVLCYLLRLFDYLRLLAQKTKDRHHYFLLMRERRRKKPITPLLRHGLFFSPALNSHINILDEEEEEEEEEKRMLDFAREKIKINS